MQEKLTGQWRPLKDRPKAANFDLYTVGVKVRRAVQNADQPHETTQIR